METNAKILTVEDEKDLREAIVTALSGEGFNVLAAEDGEAGLATALKERPDLILLDITMPKMDGLSVLRELRKDDWGKNVKVIVMTAHDDMGKIAEVLEAGGNEYVVKTDVSLAGIVAKAKEKLRA
ncbi:MAG TPA: response regulator [Candidatus Paceibacterota bacterium]|nr:response regulator [Candidatus Paceibacterota bacterium]